MHPGLPCFYKKKGDKSQTELLRGSTIEMSNGDIFSLHSNPECEFKVIQDDVDTSDDTEGDSGDDIPVSLHRV